MIELRPYLPHDAVELCEDESKFGLAMYNQTGPSYSLFVDGKLIACGGVRMGVGEAWFIMNDGDRDGMKSSDFNSDKRTILRTCRSQLDLIMRNNRLWKLYAEPDMSKTFIKALNFKEQPTFVR